MQQNNYKYFAFISYNSKDTEWGKRIQKKLENYRMPATLCSENGWKRKPINPVFFAPTDIQPGGLTEELQERLNASKNLIVICSPNSAKSQWVGKEIEFFHQLGRTKHIHFFIVEGTPHSGNEDTECFNPVVDKLGIDEILGVNINERTQTYPFTNISWPWMDKQRAYVQLISKLLNIEFDNIWQRHKRQLIKKSIAWVIGIIAVMLSLYSVWQSNQPVDVEMRINDISVYNGNLPPLHNAIVTMALDNEIKKDTLLTMDNVGVFKNIPHHYLNNKVRINIECPDFLPVDTLVPLSRTLTIDMRRNPDIYGKVRFMLWNPHHEKPVANTEVTVNGLSVLSDSDGYVSLEIPLANQNTAYPIHSAVPLENKLLYLPCGPDDIILTK